MSTNDIQAEGRLAADSGHLTLPMAAIGLLQGLGIVALANLVSFNSLWSSVPLQVLNSLLLAMPLAFYLSGGTAMSSRQRAGYLLCMALLTSGLAIYAGWMAGGVLVEGTPRIHWSVGHVAALAGLGFVLVPLIAGWRPQKAQTGRWDYSVLFEIAWRNALLVVTVAALTGLFWGVMLAGAALLGVIGLDGVLTLMAQEWFNFPVTGTVIGAAFAQGIMRAEWLLGLRRFWLGMNAWLLPLLLGFAFVWALAVPFTGLESLFATRMASLLLLGVAAIGITCLNAAWEDGLRAPVYPAWLRAVLCFAWLAIIPVTLVAGWALLIRVNQYGWTEERILGAFVCVVFTGYAIGYGLSVLPRKIPARWMPTVGNTNIFMALFTVGLVILLLTPVADPRRLAVNDQVGRLLEGQVDSDNFDYRYLLHSSGRWGRQALSGLEKLEGGPRETAIAAAAREAQQEIPEVPALTAEQVRERIGIVGGGELLEPELVVLIMNANQSNAPDCYIAPEACLAWRRDLDGDDDAEVLIINGDRDYSTAHLYSRKQGAWRWVTYYSAGKIDWWQAAVSGEISVGKPGWPELGDGKQLQSPSMY